MTLPTEITSCVLCRDLGATWWHVGGADGLQEAVAARAFGHHAQEEHPGVLRAVKGCSTCQEVLVALSASFAPAGQAIPHQDGSVLHPSQLHFARHILQDMRATTT